MQLCSGLVWSQDWTYKGWVQAYTHLFLQRSRTMQHKGVFDCVFFSVHLVSYNRLIHAGSSEEMPITSEFSSPAEARSVVQEVLGVFDREVACGVPLTFVYWSLTETMRPCKWSSSLCYCRSGQKKVVPHSSSCLHSVALAALRVTRREEEGTRRDGKKKKKRCRNIQLFPCAILTVIF